MIHKILVPTDFSAQADAALERAQELASATGSELLLLHVRDSYPYIAPEGLLFIPAGFDQELRMALQKALDDKVDKVRARGLRARGLLVTGAAHQDIDAAAQREHVDLIVMGTHGRSGFRRLMIGSVADRVARSAKVPVLVVRSEEQS